MKLEEIEKLCADATPGHWWVKKCPACKNAVHIQWDLDNLYGTKEEDIKFIAASRMLMPKLLAVAKAAKEMRDYPQIAENCLACMQRFDDAIADLETK